MLSRILGWFGKGSGNDKTHAQKRARPGSATAHLFEKQASQSAERKQRPAAKPGDGFNPYDTGKFDRSASWERISKTQR